MKEITLDLTKAKNYIGEIYKDLPQDCLFNKVLCGAGGTHLALKNDIPYIILVPYIELINSKVKNTEEYAGIQPVCGKVTEAELIKAFDSNCKKFLGTYHSLPKILKALSKSSSKKAKDFQLLVDEAHMLTEGDDKDFMHNEINFILQAYTEFKSVCFMTATPYEEESIPEQLLHLPLIKAKWSTLGTTQLVAQKIEGKFNDYICQIALEHIDGRKQGDPFFFYNSVEAIAIIAKKLIDSKICDVKDIRIIAADKNDAYLKKYAHKDLFIESTHDCRINPKKITFVTAKAFEGCDIIQEEGVTYICADGKKKHTRLEIHTKIPQIVNRIRNSKYKETAYLLYTTSFTKDCRTKEEFKAFIEKEMKDTAEALAELNTLKSDKLKSYMDSDKLDSDEYLTKDLEGNLIVNPNAGKRALSQWASANQLFYYNAYDSEHITNVKPKSTLLEIINKGESIKFFHPPSGTDKIKLGGKAANFRKLCLDYIEALETKDIEQIKFIEDFSSILKDARATFKNNVIEHIRASSCQESKLIQRIEIQNKTNIHLDSIPMKLNLKKSQFYSLKDIKTKLTTIYEEMGINKKAKASDIEALYKVHKTVKSGTNGYIII